MATTASATPLAVGADGREVFLLAGEFAYARLPRRRWAQSLAALRDADLSAVTVTVPWGWHEPEEGEFDLTGQSHPQRDLRGALDLCAEHGLYVILRPGPYVGGHGQDGGIPRWLLDTRPEILALDAQGRQPGPDALDPPITYLHPVYQAYVAGWYQALLPLVRRSLAAQQGRIALVEIDHRPSYWGGLHEGDPLAVDYSPWVVGLNGRPGLYQRWLAAQYGHVERLNERYGTRYEAFAGVQPPRRPPASCRELPWFGDWRRCKMDLLNQHLEYLHDWLRDGGVDVPIVVLYPYQSPLAVRYCADYFRARGKPVLAAHACAGPQPGEEVALGQVAGTAELARRWVKGTALPPANLETPAARADGLELVCALQLAHGLNALGLAAAAAHSPCELRPGSAAVRRLGRFLRTHGECLARTEPLADLALGWYEPYEDCSQQGDARSWGWRDDYRDVLGAQLGLACGSRQPAPGGLLGLLAMAGLSYAMLDLQRDPLEEWLAHPQLWVLGLDFLAASVQRELISYVRAGGGLVMLPRVPYLDEHLQPCTLLDVLFPAQPTVPQPGQCVSLRQGCETSAAGPIDTFDLPPGCEALAWHAGSGLACAYRTAYGRGSATLLGFAPAPRAADWLEQRRFVGQLAEQAGVRRHAASEAMNLHVVERAACAGSPAAPAYLFAINPSAGTASSRITYTHPCTGEPAHMPRRLKGVEVGGRGALILCLELPIPSTGLTIAYSTSQVQGWTVERDYVRLALYGPPQTMGELALRTARNAKAPSTGSAHLEHASDEAGELLLLTYPHHQGTTILRLQA